MIASILVMTGLLAAPQAVTEQITSGPCSPTIANIAGDVTLTCIGVTAHALEALNVQIARKKLDIRAAVREANLWVDRYREVEKALREASADRELSRKAQEYLEAGEIDKAGEILDRILETDERDEDRIAANHYYRALIFELQFQPLEALPHFEKAHQYRPDDMRYTNAYANVLWRENRATAARALFESNLRKLREVVQSQPAQLPNLARTLQSLGNLYTRAKEFPKAESALREALDIRVKLAVSEPKYEADIAAIENQLGALYIQTDRLTEARSALGESLTRSRAMARQNPNVYEPEVASVLHNLGSLYCRLGQVTECERAYKDAEEAWRKLAKRTPAYRADLARTLNALGVMYRETKKPERSVDALNEASEIRADLAAQNPDAYLPETADTIRNLAILVAGVGDNQQAERLYDKAVGIFRALAEQDRASFGFELARTLSRLGNMFRDYNLPARAESPLKEALEIYGQLANDRPGEYLVYVGGTLADLALIYLDRKSPAQAQPYAEEALAVRGQLWKSDPGKYGDEYAKGLLIRAALVAPESPGQQDRPNRLRQPTPSKRMPGSS
jgi:tetratricopeptide (TPR) repeat protein